MTESMPTGEVSARMPVANDDPAASLRAMLQLHRDLLADIALEKKHEAVLEQLCQEAEKLVGGALASVMLYNPADERLYVHVAPSLPRDAIARLNGLSRNDGSCGNAVHHNSPMFVSDTFTDERWAGIRGFAKDYGVRACWSFPVRDGNEPIGSFALSSFEIREPSDFEQTVLDICASIVGIVLQRQRNEQSLDWLARHDALTGLPNREQVATRFSAIQVARRRALQDDAVVVGFADIVRFREINERGGYQLGDAMLVRLGNRMRNAMPAKSEVGRLGGDQFVLLFEGVRNRTQLIDDINALLAAVRRLIEIDGTGLQIELTLGLCWVADRDVEFMSTLNCADQALRAAKADRSERYVIHRHVPEAR